MTNEIMNKKVILAGILLLILTISIGAGVYYGVNRNQNKRSIAAGGSKTGCSDTCSGDPPTCSGDTKNGTSCSAVSVSGMPDNFDIWALDDQYHQANSKCTVRSGTTQADCTCDVPGGLTYCWMPLTYLAKNAGVQGRRFYMLVYDKATGGLIGGSKTEYVAFLDNGSSQSRWGYDTGHDGTWIVQNCGQRKEYHEEADLYSPGSWVETGNVLYAEAAGCNTTPPPPPPPPPPTPIGACQKVTPSKDLKTVKIGDKVTFTGYGTVTNPGSSDSIDQIEFTILKDSVQAVKQVVNTTLDTAGVWKATLDYTVSAAGSFSVQIRVHQSNGNWYQ